LYKSFYGLTRNPFEITPDPRFFYGTARHNEALASLYYGIERRKGFLVVTGEVGTGKTLLARCLFQILRHQKVSFAYVFNPLLPPLEFLQYAANDLGIPSIKKMSKGELLAELNRYLISRYHQNSTAVLIVDEAHLLSWELLEEIRLLTNLETAEQKLLQIVLIGQQELDQKLESKDLRQLKQRIALRSRLDPLSLDETRKYVSVRLFLAGAKECHQGIFSDAALELVHRYSNGVPRLVNTLCEAGLVAGFATKSSTVLPEFIEEAAMDFRLSPKPSDAVINDSPARATGGNVNAQAGASSDTFPAASALL
jgi:type II secretory pathway predicted ATPase ExeA